MDILISLNTNSLVPARKLKVERAKKEMDLAQKDLNQFQTKIGKKDPEHRASDNEKLKLKRERNGRKRSRVNVENQKLALAQQIDGLELAKKRAKDNKNPTQVKQIQQRLKRLKERMAEIKPIKRTSGAKKTVRRKVFVKNA